MRKVSGWAAPFVDGEVGEPRNVTPPDASLRLWHRDRVDEARSRAVEHKWKAKAYALRAAIALLIWQIHLGFWVSCIAVSALLICGLMSILHVEAWNMARFESKQELD
jgi:hypothetical protein